tara:strand:+ start:205 stop:828 length:624 start_codon:yes stop_codon:yes gene_type:complete
MVKLWLISKDLPLKKISSQELLWSKKLSGIRRQEYEHSRGYIRNILSILFDKPSLDIPIYAPPSKPIKLLEKEMGFISISHCKDCLLIGWSGSPIGVDLEMRERSVRFNKILNKFVHEKESSLFLNAFENSNYLAMELWTLKEAAIKFYGHKEQTFLLDWICNFRKNNIKNIKHNIEIPSSTFQFMHWQIAIVSNKINKKTFPIICY